MWWACKAPELGMQRMEELLKAMKIQRKLVRVPKGEVSINNFQSIACEVLTPAGRLLNRNRGTTQSDCAIATTVTGRNKSRSTATVEICEASSFLALAAAFSDFLLSSAVGWPLLTQRKMAIMLKFAASNIALGRYVPILTKRSRCIRR